MADDKQKYNRNLTTTHGDRTTETTHEPKVTTKTEQIVNGFYNPDGTPNAAAQQEFEAQRRATAAAYGIDPETGRVQRRYISDILGIDPEVMRKQRQQEEELNRAKQKESALYNSLAVLGDMITTAGGGNVWQRNADQHAKEAHANNLALEREQQAEDIANNAKLRTTEQAYAAAVQKLRDSVGTAFGTKISNTVEQGGKTTAKTTQGKDTTTGYIEGRTGKGNGSGSGGGGGNNLLMNVKSTSSGKIHSFELTKQQFDAVTSLLKEHYTQLLNDDNPVFVDDIEDKLSKSHILIGKEKDGSPIFDYNMMLQNGNYYELSDAVAHKIEEITGNKIKFPRHTADRAFHLQTTQEQETPRGGF